MERDPEVVGWEELRVDVETTLPVDEAGRRAERKRRPVGPSLSKSGEFGLLVEDSDVDASDGIGQKEPDPETQAGSSDDAKDEATDDSGDDTRTDTDAEGEAAQQEADSDASTGPEPTPEPGRHKA